MKRILVIDDEEWLREMIHVALSDRGYEVVEVGDGASGVDLARRHPPDLVLCDVNMAKMDGYATLSAFREAPATATVPFILMTGMADNEGMRHGMELGASDYLPKPFSIEDLYGAVEARLKMAEKVREQADEALKGLRDNLSMMLPHELRTPLNGILAYGDLLAADPGSLAPEEIADMGRTIAESGRALHRLIETFLAYSQLEIIQVDPQKIAWLRTQSTPAAQTVVEQVARGLAEEAGRPADLQLELESASVNVSGEYFSKLIGELIHNAFKFSQAGSPVQVTLSCRPGECVLSVSDRGRGLSSEQVKKLGAFMQFDRKTHEQQGLGLGLTVARRLAEIHGGKVNLTSESGVGTTVTVTLPAVCS